MTNSKESLKSKIILLRGSFIENFSELESMLDLNIVNYFSNNEITRNDLELLIIKTNRITTESKRQIFDFIAKNRFSKRYNKYKRFHSYLIKLIEFRNIIAHYVADYSIEAVNSQNEQISFIKYKNVESKVTFTTGEIEFMFKTMDICTEMISSYSEIDIFQKNK